MSCQITNHNTAQPQLWSQTSTEVATFLRDISTHLDIFKAPSLEHFCKVLRFTDYRHTQAKSLIFCDQNSNPNPK